MCMTAFPSRQFWRKWSWMDSCHGDWDVGGGGGGGGGGCCCCCCWLLVRWLWWLLLLLFLLFLLSVQTFILHMNISISMYIPCTQIIHLSTLKHIFYMYFKYICTYHGTYLPFSGIIVLSQIFVPSKSLDSRVSSGIVETGHHDKVSYP